MRGSCTKASSMAMTLSLLALRTLITCSHVNLSPPHLPLQAATAGKGGISSSRTPTATVPLTIYINFAP